MRTPPLKDLGRSWRDRSLASPRFTRLAGRLPRPSGGRWERLLPVARDGAPTGLPDDVVDAALTKLGGGRPQRIAHVRLGGWKPDAWTTRVFVTDEAGARHTFVCKLTDYDDQVPAFDGLPFEPGLPEHGVLSSVERDGGGELGTWMPAPLTSRHLGGRRFVFAITDVGATHHARSDPDSMLRAIDALAPLHEALDGAALDGAELLDLRPTSGRGALVEYVGRHLTAAPESGADELAGRAAELVDACATPAWASATVRTVHGDPNRSNVVFPRRGRPLFIDWEWAGVGPEHGDLACLTKVLPVELEDEGVRRFAAARTATDLDAHRELHQRAKLLRALLDSSFLCAQRSARPGGVRFDIDGPIGRAHAAAAALGLAGART
ncbi:MAG: aminoglycoside phosphotransferase family protein [Actinomycetota bacterium]